MGLCIAYDTPYDGIYKYCINKASDFAKRLKILPELYPNMKHIASKGSQYDFENQEFKNRLSLKTNKNKSNKVAPQVIGQPNPQQFCNLINIEFTSKQSLKKYIQENITVILPILVHYTFDCPIVYYNENSNTIKLIILKKNIEWDKYNYKWTKNYDNWNSSSTLKIIINKKEYTLLEVQFHSGDTGKRKNMAIRWNFVNFINIFNENLDIKLIS